MRPAPNAERLSRMERLFHDAAARAPEDREAFLAAAAADDPSLAAEVAELLASADPPSPLLDGDASPDLVGSRIGPCHVKGFLASGGMADVYRAVRTADDVELHVALKVMRRGLDTGSMVARFRRERRTLARLRHPHIVALADVGVLPDGRPWLAMELIDGEPIDRWCARRGLDARARIGLFVEVCGAVHHAHRHLVVHCDLKPSNILVGEEGTPKLLDFGIARLLAAEGDDEPADEMPAPLTPGWASPEQLRGEPASTASDVHALGVLLARIVDARTPTALAADLASVAAMASHADPAARYASAAELAGDVLAARDGLPLRAHPGSATHRVRRFASRHRWAVVGASGLLLGLLVGVAGLWYGWRSAAHDASVGWRAHSQVVEVVSLLQEVVRRTEGGGLDAALDAVAARLPDHADAPETEGRLRFALAALYEQVGRQEAALQHVERGLAIARVARSFDRRTVREAEERLARLTALRPKGP
ncbi:MAG: serine/threonine protein kinase [Planctomycetes bacterium]|nr:serine/threonine protein kinase [Planctomycetota bacterium]